MIIKAEDFTVKMKLVSAELRNEQIDEIRQRFETLEYPETSWFTRPACNIFITPK